MLSASKAPLDMSLGMFFYTSTIDGLDGRVKCRLEDFIVEELVAPNIFMEPPSEGNYALLLIEKSGIDTLEALRRLASSLKAPLNHISYAGLKDARAITMQRLSIKNIPPSRIESLTIPNLRILKAQSYHKLLNRGELYGNRFTITIRNITSSSREALSKVRAIFNSLLKSGGFLNYFGYQRFGTIRPNTHIVGKMILKGRLEEAVNEILFHIYEGESEEVRKARGCGDLKEALRLMPRTMIYERRMLRYLLHHPNDYVGALKTIHIKLLKIMVEAYQAYLFNKMLSFRAQNLREYHLPVEGDYVVSNGGSFRIESSKALEEATSMIKEFRASVAIPLPSYELKLQPTIPTYLETVLKEEDVSLDEFKVKALPQIKTHSKLRKVVCRPEGFTILNLSKDDLAQEDRVKMVLRFTLRKGSYATSLLREFMKPNDPLRSGF